MKRTLHTDPWPDPTLTPGVSKHARTRMQQRAIPREQVLSAMLHGRELRRAEVVFHVVGRREVEAARSRGLRIERLEGIHVVCTTRGTVITVYRDRQLRGLNRFRKSLG